MKFAIRRASSSEGKPVPEAVPETVDLISMSGHKYGTTEIHTIEVNTLEDLIKLVDREGAIIVSRLEGRYDLHIYDDYVE